ncbi:MAG: hypothetical protein ACI4J5_03530, partial [Oscillospiraceae bacterium]
KGGTVSLDAVEFFTKTKRSGESDNPKADFPPPDSVTTSAALTETEPVTETSAAENIPEKSDGSRGMRFIIIFLISAATGAVVYFIFPKLKK